MAGCGSPRTQPGRAVLRRASGEFDELNSPIKDKSGEPILVPNGVDLKTGEPQPNTPLQDAIPDAANYEKGLIIDDKPDGRPIRKDRHEIRGRWDHNFQTSSVVQKNLSFLKNLVQQKPELSAGLSGAIEMLRQATEAGRGIYVTF